MKCIHCYREIGDDNKFCNYCGTMQPIDKEAYIREHPELAGAIIDEENTRWGQSNTSSQPPRSDAQAPQSTQSPLSPPSPPTSGWAPSEVVTPAIANQQQAQVVTPGGATGDIPIQCPDCGNIIPANSSSCPYCGCPFVTPSQQREEEFSPADLPMVPAPTQDDYAYNPRDYQRTDYQRSDYQRTDYQKRNDTGMSGWAKALLTISIIMLVGAIGGGLYYFLFYNRVGQLTPDEDVVKFSRRGGTKTVSLTTDATDIEVVKKPDWVTVDVGNQEIVIKCQQLEAFDDRDGIIKLKAGNKEAKITVKQSSKATYMRLSQDLIKTGHNSEEVVINLDTDGDPSSIDFDIDDHYMCSLTDKSSTGFTVIIEENTSSSPRQCSITISSGSEKETLTIIQAGQCIYCDGTGRTTCDAYNCDNGHIRCSSCGGDGEIYEGFNYDLGESIFTQCDVCSGRGYISCERCGGRGYNSCDHCNGTGNNFTRN